MIATVTETLGFAALVIGTYELTGRGWALVVLAASLLLVGQGLDGVRIRLRRRKPEPKRKRAEQPLTNEALDQLASALAESSKPESR